MAREVVERVVTVEVPVHQTAREAAPATQPATPVAPTGVAGTAARVHSAQLDALRVVRNSSGVPRFRGGAGPRAGTVRPVAIAQAQTWAMDGSVEAASSMGVAPGGVGG